MGLERNREKTRIVDLKQVGASLDFLGYTFRYDRDRHGRPWRYLNVVPSKKALKKERAALRDMTSSRYCFQPIPALIEDLNRNLQGWAAYFSFGYPSNAYGNLNYYASTPPTALSCAPRRQPLRASADAWPAVSDSAASLRSIVYMRAGCVMWPPQKCGVQLVSCVEAREYRR